MSRMDRSLGETPPAPAPPGIVTEPTHSPEGVDLTLVRWMLSLTPLERLEVLQDTLWSIRRLRDASWKRRGR
jgi:hypothetical protein